MLSSRSVNFSLMIFSMLMVGMWSLRTATIVVRAAVEGVKQALNHVSIVLSTEVVVNSFFDW